HICFEGNQGKTPFRSPFGGMEFSEKLSEEDLHAFGRYIFEHLKEKQITIISAPEAYDSEHFSRELYLWNSLGMNLATTHLHAVMKVDDTPFEKILADKEFIRKYNKCVKEGFSFIEEPIEQLERVYRFIEEQYIEKGYTVSLCWDEMFRLTKSFPKRVNIFTVQKEGNLLAASICIQPRKHILYDFYHAHDPLYNAQSPVIFLIGQIYAYAKNHGYYLLDLGSSQTENGPDFPLLNFKQKLGGTLSVKGIFIKG
ncbi:MAG: GNAT family N-acetyltransferase, partial [Cyclobacteriaceae bacterium]|nr:GNAT family N-acetyltransferase [Cyclobacteriaceae bacterium]